MADLLELWHDENGSYPPNSLTDGNSFIQHLLIVVASRVVNLMKHPRARHIKKVHSIERDKSLRLQRIPRNRSICDFCHILVSYD